MRRIPGLLPLVLLSFAIPARAAELKGSCLLSDAHPAPGVKVSAVPFETSEEEARREARRLPASAPLATATTGSDGRFALAVEKPDALFVVEAAGQGLVPMRLEGVWDGGDRGVPDEIPAVFLPKGAPLSGKVVDASGKPVAGAEVAILPRGVVEPLEARRSVTTASDGTFAFTTASPEVNTLRVETTGFAPVRITGVRPGALAPPVVLSAGAAASGTVVRADGQPAAGAFVRWEGETATRWVEADEAGRFTIPDAPTGIGRLVAIGADGDRGELARVALPRKEASRVALVRAAAFSGRVVDAATLRPVPRARVTARAAGVLRASFSGPDGRYRLAPVPPGSLRLRADHPRYATWTREVRLAAGEAKELDAALAPGAPLVAKVVDEDRAPVGGATGTFDAGASGVAGSAVSGKDGAMRFSRVRPGERTLTVEHPGFVSARLTVSPAAGEAGAPTTVVLHRGVSVSGRVHDAAGAPIARVLVLVDRRGGGENMRRPVSTGPDGRFTAAGLDPGDWSFIFQAAGWAIEKVSPVKIGADRHAAPLDVTLAPAAPIRGFVRTKSGTPLEGRFVRVREIENAYGGGAPTPTGPDGAFVVDGLRKGKSYDLTVFGPGADAELRGVVAPAEGVVVLASGKGTLAGRVVDAASGRPVRDFVADAQTDASSLPLSTFGPGRGAMRWFGFQDDEGAFSLDDVPAGTWTLLVQAKGYQTARLAGLVLADEGKKDGIEVRLQPGATLAGRVLDARTSRPVPDAPVWVSGAPIDVRASASTDADGRFSVEGLAPGRHRVTVRHPEFVPARQDAEVGRSGGSVEVRLAAGGAIGGTVVSSERQPASGARVMLSESSLEFASSRRAVADASGRFRFDHVGAGRYFVSAEFDARRSERTSVVLPDGESNEDLVLALAGGGVTIRGIVTGLADLAGVRVEVSGSAPSWSASTAAGPDGRFELTGVPAGTVSLRAHANAEGGRARFAFKEVTASPEQPVLETEIAFEAGVALRGRVTRKGEPAEGLTVTAGRDGGSVGGSARTDASGAYRIDALPPGRYGVVAFDRSARLPSKVRTIELSADGTLDFELPAAGISGVVRDAAAHRPLPGAEVAVDLPTGSTKKAVADSNGRFALEGLEARGYVVVTRMPGFLAEKREAAASEGGDDVVVELRRAEAIGIQVRDAVHGIPLTGVEAWVADAAKRQVHYSGHVSLDSDGRGEIPSLPPGVVFLRVTSPGYAPADVSNVNVPSAALAIALVPAGSVELHAGPATFAGGAGRVAILDESGAVYPYGPDVVRFREPVQRLQEVAIGSYTAQVVGGGAIPFVVREGKTTVVELP